MLRRREESGKRLIMSRERQDDEERLRRTMGRNTGRQEKMTNRERTQMKNREKTTTAAVYI